MKSQIETKHMVTLHDPLQHLDDIRLLRLPDILDCLRISKSNWYAGIKSGHYPKPLKLSARTSVWRREDIRKLVEELKSDV